MRRDKVRTTQAGASAANDPQKALETSNWTRPNICRPHSSRHVSALALRPVRLLITPMRLLPPAAPRPFLVPLWHLAASVSVNAKRVTNTFTRLTVQTT